MHINTYSYVKTCSNIFLLDSKKRAILLPPLHQLQVVFQIRISEFSICDTTLCVWDLTKILKWKHEIIYTAAYSSYVTFVAFVFACKCWNLWVSCLLWWNLTNRIKNKKWKKTFSYLTPHDCGKILLNAPSVYYICYYIFFVMVRVALARLDWHCSTDWTQFSSPSLCPIDTKVVKQTH